MAEERDIQGRSPAHSSSMLSYLLILLTSTILYSIAFFAISSPKELSYIADQGYLITSISIVTAIKFILLSQLVSKPSFISWPTIPLAMIFSICVLIYISIFQYYTGHIFEFVGSDSTTYRAVSLNLARLPMTQWPEYMTDQTKYNFSDWTYFFVLGGVGKISTSEYLPRVLNIVLTMICFSELKKSAIMIGLSKASALSLAIVFLFNPLVIFYAASGLKECLMMTVIMCFFRSLLLRPITPRSFMMIWCMILLTLGLRIPIALFMLISVVFVFSAPNVTTMRLIFATLVLSVLYYTANSYELLYYIKQYLGAVARGASVGLFPVVANGIFGPFPNPSFHEFDRVSWLYALGLLEKSILTPAFLLGGLHLVRQGDSRLSLVVFCLAIILSLIATGVTFKARYIMPYLPVFLLVAWLGKEHFAKKEMTFSLLTAITVVPTFVLWNGLLR